MSQYYPQHVVEIMDHHSTASETDSLPPKMPAKNRSTDLELSVEQIVEYYRARWKIESGFKEIKQDEVFISGSYEYPLPQFLSKKQANEEGGPGLRVFSVKSF